MSAENAIEVFETPTFKKAFKKLAEREKVAVEDEIDLIIADPELGELKKGDLSHLRVHKFKLNDAQVLLGYSWKAAELKLYLLTMGPHENFYKAAKKRRPADLKFIDSP
ncbi:type II toxin-antitoxin system RelE/ParE family toxin [Sedimenticola hydrogenitrophicus]|uniref:type II toxin-antitoxin system RelE/ParE family toxin n=1 Tax=Sedimenticola hydrogenitrophicus TaxID=2967975 RepID=UPI0021A3AFF7|nr:type II toxin-antitoxin system RelE/ParE family toxin [Sedimenticola hydrogenitrophicus]